MKNIEILQKVADLVGFKFSSVSYSFAEVELDGGVIITNSTEGDFALGDTISVKNEDGTFTIVGSGTHRLADGIKIFITDEEGKLVEIKDAEEPEEVDVGSQSANPNRVKARFIASYSRATRNCLSHRTMELPGAVVARSCGWCNCCW